MEKFISNIKRNCPWLTEDMVNEITDLGLTWGLVPHPNDRLQLYRENRCGPHGTVPLAISEDIHKICRHVLDVEYPAFGHINVNVKESLFVTPAGVLVCVTHAICAGVTSVRILFNKIACGLIAQGDDAIRVFYKKCEGGVGK